MIVYLYLHLLIVILSALFGFLIDANNLIQWSLYESENAQ